MGVFGGASYLNVNNIDRGGGLGPQPFTDYDQYAGDIKVDYLLGCDQMLTVSLQHLQQNRVPRTDKWPDSQRRFDPQQRDLGYIRWQGSSPGSVVDSWMITGSYHQMRERAKRRDLGDAYREVGEFTVGTTGINLTLGTDVGWAGRLTYGADWYHDEVEAWKYRLFDNGTVQGRTPQFPDDAYYERVAGFLQWEVDLTERLLAVTGVRYTNIDTGATVANFDTSDPQFPNVDPIQTPFNDNFQDWTASVGLTYKLTPCLHLVGTVAEGFRAPNLDELTTVSDNVFDDGVDLPTTGLGPEQSISYEIGTKLNYDRLRGQIFYFWNDLSGLSQRVLVRSVGGVDYFRRENVGSAVVQGFELAGEYLLTTRWSVYGNFWTIYGQNLTDNEPLRRIPPSQGVLGLRWRDRQARNWFELYSWMVAKQDRLSPGDIRDSRIPDGGTPGYGIVSARVGTYIGRHQRVTLGIDNIFDKAYRVHGSGVDGGGISGEFSYELIY
jgi:outer membrane receptor protein involved in Fe transport